MQELWAVGFNALGQVQRISTHGPFDDIRCFTKIAEARTIGMLYAGWSQSVFTLDGVLYVLGIPLSGVLRREEQELDLSSSLSFDIGPSSELISVAGSESDGLQAFSMTTPSKHIFHIIVPELDESLNASKSAGPLVTGEASLIHGKPLSRPLSADETGGLRVFAVAMASSGVTAAIFCKSVSGECFSKVKGKTSDYEYAKTSFEVVEFGTFSDFLVYLRDSHEPALCSGPVLEKQNIEGKPLRKFTIPGQPKRLLASALSFILLTKDGLVWTWACESRYSHALGRDTQGSSANAVCPGVVEEVVGLNIVHIAVGSWMAGAISEGGEAWIWGCDAPGSHQGAGAMTRHKTLTNLRELSQTGKNRGDLLIKICPSVTEQVNPKENQTQFLLEADEVDSLVEVRDLAIGDAHVLVLDHSGIVWAFGSNAKGQLGIPSIELEGAIVEQQDTSGTLDEEYIGKWTPTNVVGRGHSDGWAVKRVFCGDFTSFLVFGEALL